MNIAPFQNWSPSEAATVNEFLNTQVGRKWLGLLLSRKPTIDMGTTEKAALTGAYSAGYESIFGQIALTRATLPPPDQSAGIKPIDPTRD